MDWRKVHLVLTITWSALLIPSVLWWHQSILWVVFMSCYANVAGHWAGYQAARAESDSN